MMPCIAVFFTDENNRGFFKVRQDLGKTDSLPGRCFEYAVAIADTIRPGNAAQAQGEDKCNENSCWYFHCQHAIDHSIKVGNGWDNTGETLNLQREPLCIISTHMYQFDMQTRASEGRKSRFEFCNMLLLLVFFLCVRWLASGMKIAKQTFC